MAFVTVTPEVIHCPRGSVSEWWEYFWCSKFCLLTSEHLGPHFNTLRYMTQQCNQIMNPADATICWISWSAPGFFFTWSCCPDCRSVVSFHRFFTVNYSEEKSHSPSSCLLSASQSSLTAPQTFLHVEGPQV